MELRQLRYFRAVAEEGNLTRAAEGLGLRSPSLSQQIRVLEKELGAALFERSAAGMAMTAAGRALLPEARVALAAVERGRRAVAAAAANPTLTIGVPAGVPGDLPTRLTTAARHAGATIEFQDLPTESQLPLLRKGVLDAGIVSLPVDAEDLTVALVSEEPLGILMARTHHLAELPTIDWPALHDQHLLWFRRDLAPGYHDAVLHHCRRHGWEPELRIATARRPITVAALASDVDCVALRPERDSTTDPDLTWRPLSTNPPKILFALAFPRDTRHLALPQLAADLHP